MVLNCRDQCIGNNPYNQDENVMPLKALMVDVTDRNQCVFNLSNIKVLKINYFQKLDIWKGIMSVISN